MGNFAGGHGHKIEVSGLRTRADAASQQGGKEHPENPDGGGSNMKKNLTRVMALLLVVIMVFALVASALSALV